MRLRSTLRSLALLAALAVIPAALRGQDDDAVRGVLSADSVVGSDTRELVVVLHGMGRTSRSMRPVELALREAGFDVLNIGYSSYCCSIPELGAAVQREIAAQRRPQHARVHFVGHSLGNIIARWVVAQDDAPPGLGRLVMLAPPNQGARMANRFSGIAGWLLEPIDELRADSAATVRRIPTPAGVEIGVIAGRDDSTVRIEETHVAGETAHIVVKGNHTFIMREPEVQRLAVEFLKSGRFTPPAAGGSR